MTDEKKFSGWKRTYISLLNAATVICIIVGIMINVGGFMGSGIFNSIFRSTVNRESASVSDEADRAGSSVMDMESFNTLKGEIAIGNVVIEYGDGYGYQFEGFPKGEEPVGKIKDGTLKLEQKVKNNRLGSVNELKSRFSSAKIIVTVPEGETLDVKLKLSVGAFEVRDFTFDDLKIDADMGSVKIEDCTADKIEVDADMGSVEINSATFDEGKIDAAMGGIELSDVVFDDADIKADMGGITVSGEFNKLEAKCSMGGIDVTTDSQDARMDLSAELGGITVNGKSEGRGYKN